MWNKAKRKPVAFLLKVKNQSHKNKTSQKISQKNKV